MGARITENNDGGAASDAEADLFAQRSVIVGDRIYCRNFSCRMRA